MERILRTRKHEIYGERIFNWSKRQSVLFAKSKSNPPKGVSHIKKICGIHCSPVIDRSMNEKILITGNTMIS
ncbi:hypothetical protein RIR_jg22642.t1 [Rhizophagus irregularis DAOM 181602=DAOM 197198]|nr:hypothetical protein RIR_jg22642.t1 [Rhizophagus irregularis DAOM 181602=DAOM 197198]